MRPVEDPVLVLNSEIHSKGGYLHAKFRVYLNPSFPFNGKNFKIEFRFQNRKLAMGISQCEISQHSFIGRILYVLFSFLVAKFLPPSQ